MERRAIKLSGVSLTSHVDDDLPDLFLGDPTRVRQILLNLTTNAIKFTSKGRVEVQVSVSAGQLRFAVRDTGIGISAEIVPHLFERFSQADGSTARRFGGTGLGLAICKRLVELMGGRIGVESTPDHGSTFWFELPLVVAEQDRRTGSGPSALTRAARRSRTILVAEDNTINQEIIETVLSQKGHAVTMVGDGAAAVGTFRDGAFDVILMDMQMPGTDGLAATREIRRLEQSESRSRTPIVALTANAMAEDAALCREAGMDAHVAKPIDWTRLFSTIDRLCVPHRCEEVEPSQVDRKAMAVFDESALESLAMLLGRDRIPDLLTAFRRETERRIALMEAPGATPADIGAHAHVLVSLAGQLGLAELSALCVETERDSSSGLCALDLAGLRAAAERAISTSYRSAYARAA